MESPSLNIRGPAAQVQMLEAGVRVDSTPRVFQSMCLAATQAVDLEQVRRLVEEQGVEPRQSAAVSASLLNMAAMGGQMPVVRYLVEEAGVDPSVPDQLVCSALSNLWLAPGEIPT